MTWFYNSHSGELTSASGVLAAPYLALLHAGIGWHELPIPASDTEAQAAAAAVRAVPGGTPPTTSIITGASNTATKAVAGIGGWTVGLGNSTGLLQRALKVIIGAVLIIAGIIRFTERDTSVLQLAKGAIA